MPEISGEVRAIFFDAVGTLLHPEPPAAEVYAAVGRRHGSRRSPADVADRFAVAFQREEEFDRRHGLRTSEERETARWRNIVAFVLDDAAEPEQCFHELFEHFARPESWRCPPEAAGVLNHLHQRGYTLGLASNYDGRLRRVLAGRPELERLRLVVISSEVGWRKPAAEFFQALTRVAGCPAHALLYLGDEPENDYHAARAAGLHAILVDPRGRAPTAHDRIARLDELLHNR